MLAMSVAFSSCKKEESIQNTPQLSTTSVESVSELKSRMMLRVVNWNTVYQYSVWGGGAVDVDVEYPATSFTGTFEKGGNAIIVGLQGGGWGVLNANLGGGSYSAYATMTKPTVPTTPSVMTVDSFDPASGVMEISFSNGGSATLTAVP